MLSLLTVALPDEVVNQESALVLSLEFVLSQAPDSVQSLFLDALQDLILGLIVLVDSVDDLDRVGLSAILVLLESAHIELLLLDCRDDLAMEEHHFPLVLVEALREVLKATFTQVLHVLLRQQTLNGVVLRVLLDEYGLEQES